MTSADVLPFRAVRDPDEVATIVAAGHRFDDWESVYVQHRWADAWAWFRFTSVERDPPIPEFDWHTLRLKPPDPVAIYLGGQLAINGLITSRQVAYEANNHAIQLEGRALTWAAATASIVDKTQEYNGMTFEQIARRVMAPTGVRHQNHRQSQRADIRARAQ
jgi:prophage tail gpP-like protein